MNCPMIIGLKYEEIKVMMIMVNVVSAKEEFL